jgi:hypothetical protein
MKAYMQAIRITLFVLILIGVGLLTTQAYWVPSLVQKIMSHDSVPVIVPVSTTIPTTPGTKGISPKPVPPTSDTRKDTGVVDVSVFIGPTCPVQTADKACDDKPYETTLVFQNTSTGKDVMTVKTDSVGHLSQTLTPGTYTVRAQSSAMLPRLSPETFTIRSNTRTKLELHFDSGIR